MAQADAVTGAVRGPRGSLGQRIAALAKLPGRFAGRLGWGVTDQAVSSLSNAATSIYVVRELGATQFGAFTLAYVTYAFALNASRGLATDPLMVRFSGTDDGTWRRAVSQCTGTAVVVGTASGLCVLAVAAILGGTAGEAFLALGLTLPGLMLQDSWRYSFFAHGRGSQAFVNDMIWVVALVPAILFLRATGHKNVFYFMLAWGASATFAAAMGPLQARVIPRVSGAYGWLKTHRDLGLRYLLEGTASSVSTQLRTYGLGVILSLTAVGYVQASATIMGPVTIIFLGMPLVLIPEGARVLRRSPRHLRLFCLAAGAGQAVCGLAWGLIVLVALPRGLGHVALGSVWRPAYPLVIPQTVTALGSAFGSGFQVGLHALGAARRSLRAMIIGSAAAVVFGLAGATILGAAGLVWGVALWTWIGVIVWGWEFRAGLRDYNQGTGTEPVRGPAGRHRNTKPVPTAGEQPAAPAAARSDPSPDPDLQPAPRLARGRPAPARPGRGRKLTWALLAVFVLAAGTGLTVYHLGARHAHERALAARLDRSRAAHDQAPGRPATTPKVTASPKAVASPVAVLRPASAAAFGPDGTSDGDNPADAALALDPGPAAAWETSWYTSARLGNLQSGTGLLIDLGSPATVTTAQLTLSATPGADLELRIGNAPSLAGTRIVARARDAGGVITLTITRPATARYLVIWFTLLPPDSTGTYQESVRDVQLTGYR